MCFQSRHDILSGFTKPLDCSEHDFSLLWIRLCLFCELTTFPSIKGPGYLS
jgi:hypothetical protein